MHSGKARRTGPAWRGPRETGPPGRPAENITAALLGPPAGAPPQAQRHVAPGSVQGVLGARPVHLKPGVDAPAREVPAAGHFQMRHSLQCSLNTPSFSGTLVWRSHPISFLFGFTDSFFKAPKARLTQPVQVSYILEAYDETSRCSSKQKHFA